MDGKIKKESADMDEIRCGACGKKLGAGIYQTLQIKCPRCNTLNFS